MAHHRKLVAGALAVNTVIVLVEAGAGFWAGSLGLVMDALHNLGDAGVSLAPAAAGVLILVFDRPFIDPLVALLVGLWILGGTLRELGRSHAELLWPGRIECGPAAHHRN